MDQKMHLQSDLNNMFLKTLIYICVKAVLILRQPLLLFIWLFIPSYSHGIPIKVHNIPSIDSVINLENPNHAVLQDAILQSINRFRAKNNVKSLTWSDSLYKASKFHLDNMNKRKFFEHNDPKDRNYPDLEKRILKFSNKFHCASENLIQYYPFNFKGKTIEYSTKKVKNRYQYLSPITKKKLEVLTYRQLADRIVENWSKSPPHRLNMLNDKFSKVGIAVYFPQYYFNTNILPLTIVADFGGCM